MTPETEGRLLRYLEGAERSKQQNGEQLSSLGKAVGRLGDKVDKLTDGFTDFRVELERQNARLQNVERRVVEVEDAAKETAEATGQHELRRLQDQVVKYEVELAGTKQQNAERRASKHSWALWAAGTIVTIGIGVAGYVLRLLIGG